MESSQFPRSGVGPENFHFWAFPRAAAAAAAAGLGTRLAVFRGGGAGGRGVRGRRESGRLQCAGGLRRETVTERRPGLGSAESLAARGGAVHRRRGERGHETRFGPACRAFVCRSWKARS